MAIRNDRGRRSFTKLAVLAAAAFLSGGAFCPPVPTPTPMLGGGIHGHVVLNLANLVTRPSGARIELPGATVTARNIADGSTASALTNAHGYFQVPHVKPGTYQVCATLSGFIPGCLGTNVQISDWTEVLADDVQLQTRESAFAGRVLLSDKKTTPCFVDRPAFRTFVQAEVTIQDSNGKIVAGPVYGNGIGEYVLPDVHLPAGRYELVADCQKARGRAPVPPVGDLAWVDISIPNSPPSIQRIEATVGGQPVRLVPPGSTVRLLAVSSDPDGDPLRYKWVDSNGVALAGTSETANLAVPAPSSRTVFVEASDGRGGFSYSAIPVTGTTATDALFTGSVLDASTGAPIGGAALTVNGQRTQSAGNGLFSISVPIALRYAISVRKVGYALLSKVTYSPAAELRLPLAQVFPTPFDAGKGGVVVGNERNGLGKVRVYLRLQPHSLMDRKGNPAVGPAQAYLYGYPPATPIPGDMSAIFKDRSSRLVTYGAVDVVLTNAGGELQLAPGATADLSMTAPTPPPPDAPAPANVPMFIFDETTGIWRQHGNLVLSGGNYQGTIRHLSAFNADLASVRTGCIEYHLDQENSPALPFYLHIVQNGQVANHEPFQVNDFAGVVHRLLPAASVDWYALPEANSLVADAIGKGTVTTTDFTSDPADPNGDFPPVGAKNGAGKPFCTSFIITATFPDHETYLVGLPGNPNPGTNATEETAYHNAADAWAGGNARPHATFSDFKSQNGFPADEATAVYYNNADLKLGRDMHCRKGAGDRIACYVSNYLDNARPPAGPGRALLSAGDAHRTGSIFQLFATVAMEWDPSQPTDTSVQFFVYNAVGNRLDVATLDSEGAKSIPQICLACHGGSYSTTDHLAHGARFLPFDLPSFKTVDTQFSPDSISDLQLDAFTRQNQLSQFRALNALVATTEQNRIPSGTNAVLELINGWYQPCGGVTNPGCNACIGGAPDCPGSFDANFRPSPWNADANTKAFYDRVVRPACRGCHVMQTSREWRDPAQMTGAFKSTIERYVCTGQGPNNQRRMPHGEVPFKTLWADRAPALFTQAPMNLAACNRQ